MKKILIVSVLVLVAVSAVVFFVACGSKGSSESGSTTYSNAKQAAASASTVSGAVSLSATVSSATSLASGSIPAGYAPGKRGKVINTSAIANLHPKLKTAVDMMTAQLRQPALRSAVQKGREFKTVSSAPITISTTTTCAGGGTATISGTDTSTTDYLENTIEVTFTDCKDSAELTHNILSGSMNAYHKKLQDNSSETANITASAFTVKVYVASDLTSTLSSTNVLSGTFNSTDNVTTGNDSANGSFTVADAQGSSMSFSFTNVTDAWTATAAGVTPPIEQHTMNGSFNLTVSLNLFNFTYDIGFTNLVNKVRSNSDFSEDAWVDGTISVSWSPVIPGVDCVPGSVIVHTDEANPIHTDGSACPTAGKVTVNNATVEFGTPSAPQVTVTVNGSSQIFADCDSMEGCMQ